MATHYTVYNICGGHNSTTHLKQAIREAQDHFSTPYIYTKKGRRPVYKDMVGEFGQKWTEFVLDVGNVD